MRKISLGLMVIMLITLITTLGWAADNNTQNQVQLTRLEGKVYYKTSGLLFFSSGWQEVEKTVTLTEGDKIKTNSRSQAELEFPDRAQVLIKEASKLELVESDSGSWQLKKINLNLGEVVVKVINQLDEDNPFQVETPSAVAGVKGTTFKVKVTNRKATEVAVKSGTVEVSSQAGSVDVTDGQLAEVKGKSKPPQVKPEPKGEGWRQEEKWLKKTEKWAEKAKKRGKKKGKEKRAKQANETPPGQEKKEENNSHSNSNPGNGEGKPSNPGNSGDSGKPSSPGRSGRGK